MAVLVRGKNIEVTPALRSYVEKNASKLTRYFDSEINVQALLASVKEDKIVEITCFVEGTALRAEEKHDDMYAAIDLVFDKLIRQIHKHKTRLAKKFKRSKVFTPVELPEPIQEDTYEVIRRKKFVVRPMDVEEAILQMNLIGHDFFVFFNEETEGVCVVYRRKNGQYGLIEPEL